MKQLQNASPDSNPTARGPGLPLVLGIIAWVPMVLYYKSDGLGGAYNMLGAFVWCLAAVLGGCVAFTGCSICHARLKGTRNSGASWWPLALLLNYGFLIYVAGYFILGLLGNMFGFGEHSPP